MRPLSGPLSLLQLRARQVTLRTMLDLPKKGVPVNGGRHALIPDVWSPGASGWSGPRYSRIIRIPSRGEYRLEIDDLVVSLEGQTVRGATLGSLGARTTLAALMGVPEPTTDAEHEALEALVEDTGE